MLSPTDSAPARNGGNAGSPGSNHRASQLPGSSGRKYLRRNGTRAPAGDQRYPSLNGRPPISIGRVPTTYATPSSCRRPSQAALSWSACSHRRQSNASVSHIAGTKAHSGNSTNSDACRIVCSHNPAHATARAAGSWGSSQTVIRIVRRALPHPDPRGGLEVQVLSRPHVECLVPRIQIPHRVDPVVLRRVIAGGGLGAQGVLADPDPPAARPRDEELPVLLPDQRRVAVAASEREPVRLERRRQTG